MRLLFLLFHPVTLLLISNVYLPFLYRSPFSSGYFPLSSLLYVSFYSFPYFILHFSPLYFSYSRSLTPSFSVPPSLPTSLSSSFPPYLPPSLPLSLHLLWAVIGGFTQHPIISITLIFSIFSLPSVTLSHLPSLSSSFSSSSLLHTHIHTFFPHTLYISASIPSNLPPSPSSLPSHPVQPTPHTVYYPVLPIPPSASTTATLSTSSPFSFHFSHAQLIHFSLLLFYLFHCHHTPLPLSALLLFFHLIHFHYSLLSLFPLSPPLPSSVSPSLTPPTSPIASPVPFREHI